MTNYINPIKIVEIMENVNLPVTYRKIQANVDSDESILTSTDVTKFIIISDKIDLNIIKTLRYYDVEIIEYRFRNIIIMSYYYDNFLIMVEWVL